MKIPVGLEGELLLKLLLPDELLLVSMLLLVAVGNELLMVPIFGTPGRTAVLSSCPARNFSRRGRLRRQHRPKPVDVEKSEKARSTTRAPRIPPF
jgi:hypothetical protein